ncbi:MAG: anthranilate phosphoribosyltransferase [Thermoplasmata archaeon]|nr:anthranilate phosphoribosyltransferase [Thermoplasmata archaeon]
MNPVEILTELVERRDLPHEIARDLMDQITEGKETAPQIAAILTALRMKGETAEELAAFASVMRLKSSHISPKVSGILVDTCGTGAAPLRTINISTISAFVVAAAGVPVAKHGNRSVTSICGSADLVEALGARITSTPAEVQSVIESVGIGFLFAPSFHPAMKYAVAPRREMGIRTVFNMIGPLTNPSGAQAQLLGVYSPDVIDRMADALGRLGTGHSMVVYGEGGLDELSTIGPSQICEVEGHSVTRRYTVTPEDFGFAVASPEDLTGTAPSASARITREILGGERGPMRDVVVLNSAAAIYLGGKSGSIGDAVPHAIESIDSGRALEKLDQFIAATQRA